VSAYADGELDRIARVCHAAVIELQAQHGDPDPSVPGDLGDATAHAVTIAGIRAILDGATPEELHETWVRTREAQGWKSGPRKDSRLKTHPCFVPYVDLPEHQRVKDRVVAAIVLAMAGQDAPELRAVYRERARLVAFLAACYPAWIGSDGGWAVVYVDTPAGQMSWHIADDDTDLFGHLSEAEGDDGPWDGHTTEQKYERLARLTASGATAEADDAEFLADAATLDSDFAEGSQ
jgi:RyR domain